MSTDTPRASSTRNAACCRPPRTRSTADVEAGRRRVEELELRLSTNIQKIRVRERELENRLELVKMEGAALIRTKDEMILEAKRTIDQLNLELNNYRGKNQELNRQSNDKQETLRRTVKALRLALSMLEGEGRGHPGRPRRKYRSESRRL